MTNFQVVHYMVVVLLVVFFVDFVVRIELVIQRYQREFHLNPEFECYCHQVLHGFQL